MNLSSSTFRARRARIAGGAASIAAVAALLCACAPSSSNSSPTVSSSSAATSAPGSTGESASAAAAQMSIYCGSKDITVAYVDGTASNSFGKIVKEQYELQVAQCPNVRSLYYAADADPQKFTTGVNAMVAQGANAILVYDPFGAATLGALRQAHNAGVKVVAFDAEPGGMAGTDYDAFVQQNNQQAGVQSGQWMAKALAGKGSTFVLGGIAGNPTSKLFFAGVQQGLGTGGVTLVQNSAIDTGWTVQGTQQAAAGVLSKDAGVSGVFEDYQALAPGVINAFSGAGKPMVAFAGTAPDNGTACLWQSLKAKGQNFPMLGLGGSTNIVESATRRAVALAEGIPDSEPTTVPFTTVFDTEAGKAPICDKSLPMDADLSANLTKAQFKQLFGS